MNLPNLETYKRLAKALNLPANVTYLDLNMTAGDIPRLTVEKLLTEEELDALTEWFVTENLTTTPTGTTTYSLERRDSLTPNDLSHLPDDEFNALAPQGHHGV